MLEYLFFHPSEILRWTPWHLLRDSTEVIVSQRFSPVCREIYGKTLISPLFTHSEWEFLRGQGHKTKLYRRSKEYTSHSGLASKQTQTFWVSHIQYCTCLMKKFSSKTSLISGNTWRKSSKTQERIMCCKVHCEKSLLARIQCPKYSPPTHPSFFTHKHKPFVCMKCLGQTFGPGWEFPNSKYKHHVSDINSQAASSTVRSHTAHWLSKPPQGLPRIWHNRLYGSHKLQSYSLKSSLFTEQLFQDNYFRNTIIFNLIIFPSEKTTAGGLQLTKIMLLEKTEAHVSSARRKSKCHFTTD